MIRRPPRSTQGVSSAASDVYKRQEYIITDYESAVIVPAKIMAMVVIDLLANGATKAKEVKANHRPLMSKQSYVKFQRERAEVSEFDGTA